MWWYILYFSWRYQHSPPSCCPYKNNPPHQGWQNWVFHLTKSSRYCEVSLSTTFSSAHNCKQCSQVLNRRLQHMLILQGWVSISLLWLFLSCQILTYNTALVTYDLILAFPTEVRCIWQRNLGAGMILYISIRYGTVLYMLLVTFSTTLVPEIVIVGVNKNISIPVLKLKFLNYAVGVSIILFTLSHSYYNFI